MTNPFMARQKGGAPAPVEQAEQQAPETRTDGEPSRAELKAMTVPELRQLARDRQLDDDGTKAELVERLAG